MINALDLIAGGSVVQFPAAPLRSGSASAVQKFQTIAYDSGGDPYVYSKTSARRATQPLVFTNVTDAVLTQLLAFIQTVSGSKTAFLWYDHAADAHTVRFESGISYTQTGHDKHRVGFSLSEDL